MSKQLSILKLHVYLHTRVKHTYLIFLTFSLKCTHFILLFIIFQVILRVKRKGNSSQKTSTLSTMKTRKVVDRVLKDWQEVLFV
jgi:hypothetical protein